MPNVKLKSATAPSAQHLRRIDNRTEFTAVRYFGSCSSSLPDVSVLFCAESASFLIDRGQFGVMREYTKCAGGERGQGGGSHI